MPKVFNIEKLWCIKYFHSTVRNGKRLPYAIFFIFVLGWLAIPDL